MGALDVKHHTDKSICSSTITYMLDGTVGLSADLALLSQAAALAREVRGIINAPLCVINCSFLEKSNFFGRRYILESRKVSFW